MGWHTTTSAEVFLDLAGAFLRSRPVEHTLPLSIAGTLRERGPHHYGAADPLFALAEPAAAATVCTPGSLDPAKAIAINEQFQQSRQLWTAKGTQPLLTSDEKYWAEGYAELVDAGMIQGGADPRQWLDNGYLPTA